MWKWIGLIFAGILVGVLFTIGAKTVEHYWREPTAGEKEKDGSGFARTQKG